MNYGNLAQNYNGYQNYNEQQLIQQQNQYFQKLNKVLEKHQDVKKTYQNVNYNYDRTERKTLIIDHSIGNGKTFNVNLIEPLFIDKQSDIFLEHFTTTQTFKHAGLNDQFPAFVLKVDQFNIQNSTNKSELQNALIIPNETSTDSAFEARIHKGKKLNYICSINPTKLTKLSGSVTGLNGSKAIFTTDGRFIAEFIIVPRKESK